MAATSEDPQADLKAGANLARCLLISLGIECPDRAGSGRGTPKLHRLAPAKCSISCLAPRLLALARPWPPRPLGWSSTGQFSFAPSPASRRSGRGEEGLWRGGGAEGLCWSAGGEAGHRLQGARLKRLRDGRPGGRAHTPLKSDCNCGDCMLFWLSGWVKLTRESSIQAERFECFQAVDRK